jgi:arsenate reductase
MVKWRGSSTRDMVNVLFICVHNAGRSQMSEAFFNQLVDGRHLGTSAGSQPSDRVNPVVVEAMKEVGIDVSGKKPKKLNADMALAADLAITMGCGDECPVITGEVREWQIDDPHGQPIEKVREIRDTIRARIESLIKELDEKHIYAST